MHKTRYRYKPIEKPFNLDKMKEKENNIIKQLKKDVTKEIKKELIKEINKKLKEIKKENLKKEITKLVIVGIVVGTVVFLLNYKITELLKKPQIELYCRGFLLSNGNHSSNFILKNKGKPIKNLDIVIISENVESWHGDYKFLTNENCTTEGGGWRRRIFCPYFSTYSEINVYVDFEKHIKESIVLYDITINGENLETKNLKCYPS